MQGLFENWLLPPRPLLKIKQKSANGIKLQNMFSLFNNKKYFPTEIDPLPFEEDAIRAKNKTKKRMEHAKSWVRKHENPTFEDKQRSRQKEVVH